MKEKRWILLFIAFAFGLPIGYSVLVENTNELPPDHPISLLSMLYTSIFLTCAMLFLPVSLLVMYIDTKRDKLVNKTES